MERRMDGRKKILIVDDDQQVCDFVDELLSHRFQIVKAHSLDDGLRKVEMDQPSLVLVDLKLRNQSGLDICKTLRDAPQTRHIPVLIFSGYGDSENVSRAFDMGADDYITKSTQPRELIARILSKVRRIEELEEDPELIACGNLMLNTRKLEASIDGNPVALSVLEFNLLRFFVNNRDRVVNRAQILKGVWKDAVVSNRTIDTHMVYLRKKLAGFNHSLATVYGAGYILRETPPPVWRPQEKTVRTFLLQKLRPK